MVRSLRALSGLSLLALVGCAGAKQSAIESAMMPPASATAPRMEGMATARRMAGRGTLEVLQRGVAVDPSRARGPIRLRGTERRR